MFHANMNSFQVRMFTVLVRTWQDINEKITAVWKEKHPDAYFNFIKYESERLDKAPGEKNYLGSDGVVEFFSEPPQEYPVLGYVGKATVQAMQSSVMQPQGTPLQMNYTESEYMMIPDNFGYMRIIMINDLKLASYEEPETQTKWEKGHIPIFKKKPAKPEEAISENSEVKSTE